MKLFLKKLKILIFLFVCIISILIFNFDDLDEKTLPYNRIKYLKEFKKELCIYLPAQELEATGPLSSILVQYGLNVKDFAEKFNKASMIYPVGLMIPVSIFYTMKEKRYDFCFRPLQLKTLLGNFIIYDESRFIYKIHVVDFYKVFLLKSEILNEKNFDKFLRNLLGTLRSFDFPLVICFDEISEEEDIYYNKKLSVTEIRKVNTYYIDDLDDEEELKEENGENN